MVRYPIRQIEAAEPTIRKVQMDLFAKASFRTDAKAITHQQHPDQKFRINRGTARVTVKRCQMLADPRQIDEAVNGSQQMILRDVIFYPKLIKQRRPALPASVPAWPIPRIYTEIESVAATTINKSFSTKLAACYKLLRQQH